jgi:hypothetical protein
MIGSSKFSFLRRVRIHDGECDAVARALHHEIEILPLSAVGKKVLSTTNERKVMSKLTFFKRIALTAVAALGFGMLSSVPSYATVTSETLTIDAADEIAQYDSATAVLTHSFVSVGTTSATDSFTLQVLPISVPSGSTASIYLSVTDSYTGTANDATADNSPDYNYGYTADAASVETVFKSTVYGSARESITIIPDEANSSNTTVMQLKLYGANKAGTYTYRVISSKSDNGLTQATTASSPSATWTVTVTARSTAATADSTLTLRTGSAALSTGVEGTDSSTLYSAYDAAATDTDPEATIWLKQKTGLSTNYAQESYTVTVTGQAYITSGTGTSLRPTSSTGLRSLTMAVPTAGTETGVEVWSTGTAGTATITFTSFSGLDLGSKTLTFHGAPTTLTVSLQYKKVLEAGLGSSSSAVAAIKVTDADGTAVIGYTPGIVSGATEVVSTGTCADVVTGDASTRDGTFVCGLTPTVTSVSGQTATITARIADPEATTTTYLTTTFDVTLGGDASTVTLTLDKSSYSPGEYMVITATAKDAAGNTPFDGQSGPSLSANKSLGGAITMNNYYDGVSTSETRSSNPRVMTASQNVFAPAASGEFRISGLDGQTTPASISVVGTVGDDAATAAAAAASDAALEAIDAANAATDAANLAAEAADAATVAAEEARDAADAATAAVEALASEVATLMAALKAQITTLAKTVAKIAKKVKA